LKKQRKKEANGENIMKVGNYEVKEGYLYTENYWAKVEGSIATIGMTDYSVKQAKDIAFLEMPRIGTSVSAGKPFGGIESAKWAGEMVSPLSGKVIESNPLLDNSPETINKDPYGKGWIVKIKMEKPEEAKRLMDSKKYCDYIKKESL
jgi:glycine cleavage system H protein